MAEKGGIEGRKFNHSSRKTGITTLIHNESQGYIFATLIRS